jgi:hypothetical protein
MGQTKVYNGQCGCDFCDKKDPKHGKQLFVALIDSVDLKENSDTKYLPHNV